MSTVTASDYGNAIPDCNWKNWNSLIVAQINGCGSKIPRGCYDRIHAVITTPIMHIAPALVSEMC